MNNLRIHQVIFALIFVLVGSFAAFAEKGLISVGFLDEKTSLQYVFDLLCVIFCMGGTFVMLRLMAFKRVKSELVEQGEKAYYKWDFVRLILIAVCVLTEVFVYYATLRSQTAHYALMVSLIASVFCIPTQRELERLTRRDNNS